MEDAQKSFTYDPKYIRNFSIIAHIDHGKSTIADRLLEQTKTVSSRDMQAQLLDDMDLERERGITIKAHAVTMYYTAKDGHTYQINFIDTPGHVDFTYEVSRSLSACEGALLVVDASQGVQAQTLANVYLAIDRNLEIITVLNKIDLPAAEPERVKIEIEELIGIDTSHAVECSAKTGLGIDLLLESLIKHVPPPKPAEDDILRCLIFDSLYDQYKGVIVSIRVISGVLRKGVQIKMMVTEKVFEVNEVGIYAPNSKPVDALRPGEVGYFIATIKKPADVKIGDTVTTVKTPAPLPLPGFKEVNPVVFAGIYPVDTSDLEVLTDSLKKLQLNDSSLFVEQESNLALGFGFRCGFLGLLHLEIVLERLEREFNLDIVTTAPSVIYKFHMTNGDVLNIDNPSNYPNVTHIKKIEEPIVLTTVLIPPDYLGAVMGLVNEKRGTLKATESAGASRIILKFHIPLAEIIVDFHDRLKSITSGYGSYEFHHDHYEEADVVKLEIRVNEELVDLLSIIVHASKAEARGRKICEKLKHEIPNQQFKVPIQAAIGSKIIARETISSIGKNVTAKCYGGDITRKRKLLEKQKKGKKKLKEYGKVQIPHETFMNVLKTE